jgi:hypothetical protein
LRLQAIEVADGLSRRAGGLEDAAIVVFHSVKPVRNVGGILLARLRADLQRGAQEHLPDFGNQFLLRAFRQDLLTISSVQRLN